MLRDVLDCHRQACLFRKLLLDLLLDLLIFSLDCKPPRSTTGMADDRTEPKAHSGWQRRGVVLVVVVGGANRLAKKRTSKLTDLVAWGLLTRREPGRHNFIDASFFRGGSKTTRKCETCFRIILV